MGKERHMPTKQKGSKGRPAQPYPRINDTFENVVKALVAPINKKAKTESEART